MIMVYCGRYILLHLHASIIRPTVNDYKRRPGQKASGRDPAAASRGIRFNGSTASRNSQTYFGGIFMFHNAVHRRTLSMFLIFCMVMDISQFAGISAFAKADTGGIISSFQKLPSSVSSQTVALGTFQSGLNLPDTLTVTVRLEPETAKSKPVSNSGGNQDESSSAVLSDTASNAGGRQQDTEPESAVPSESMAASSAVCPDAASDAGDRQEDTEPESAALSESMAASPANTGDTQPDSSAKAAVSDAVTREIPVTWVSSPDYDGDTAGKYEFTPVLPDGYSLGDGVELPEITVTVEKSAGTITAFGKFTDSVRWQRTDSPELPTSVKGTVGGKSVDIPVAWQADHDFDIASPEKGLYVFTAQPDGYSIKDGVEPPRIAVYVPVFSGLMSMLLSSVMSSKADLSIETAAQLSELAVLVNDGKLESFITGSSSGTVSVALENDLDLSGYGEGYNGGKGWTPIGEHVDGKNDIPFKGKFDGGNHTVIGLYINDSSLVGAGLFGAVSGTVENLELSDINVTGNKYVGGVAGCVSGGTVQSCCVTGTVASPVSDKHYYVGGVAGRVNDGTVQNCCVTGTVTGYSEIGGVVGFTKTNNAVQKCYAAGTVNGEDKVGGVVGYADSPMQNCYAANTVRGNDSVGGVAGFVESDKTIKYCYSTGTVSGSNSVGGVVGYANGMEGGKLQNCTALNPSVSGSGAGRVDGCSFVSKIIYSGNYAWSGMAGGGNNKTANGRDGADAGASKIQNTSFWTNTLGFDGCVWTIEDNKLPVLKNVSGEQDGSIPVYILTSSSQPFLGNGTTNDPYQISSAEQLAKLAELVNAENTTYNSATYKLTCDLDLSAYGKNYNGGKGWVPIGRYSNTNNIPFKGTFDGGGHTVTGLYINDPLLDGAGLFGCLNDGTVKNCRFTGAVSGNNFVGSAAGYMKNSSTMENCSSACTVSGSYHVGVIAGYADNGTVQNCYSTGTVSGRYDVGGIVGGVGSSTVQNCYSTSTVSSPVLIGGIVGGVYRFSTVQYCAALNRSFSGNNNLGRVAGKLDSGTLFGNYAWSGMTVNGKSVSSSNAGGINGKDASASDIQSASFWTGTLRFDGSIWTIAGNKLPVLKNVPGDQDNSIPLYILAASSKPFLGRGSSYQPYQISSAEQLAELANLVNAANSTYNLATYKLTCNLDLSAYGKNYNGGKGWVPIGRYSNTNNIPFQGTFDGGGHTVSGLYINDSTLDGAGLFGCIDNGTVKNCRFTGAVSGRDCVGSATGYILGYTYQGRVYESTVENCSSACTINGRSQVGGMVGWEGGSTLQNCYSTGTVKGSDQVGGMVGHLNEGTMQNCYTTSTVSGNSNVGGVAGLMQLGLVKNCTALNPSVSGSSNLGRVAGQNSYDLGTLFGNYAWSGMTVNGKSVSSSNADSINGADASPEMILSETAFWTNTLKFSSDDWTIAANRLPVLKSIFGTQSGAPGLYLMPQNITYASLTKTQFTYNGALQKPGVKFGDITLTEGKDYSIKITSTDDSGDGTSAGINAGKATITLNGKGNYSGTTTANYTIGKVPMKKVTLSGTQFTYNGALQKPGVKFGDITLTEGKDYSIEITSTDDSGDGTSAGINAGKVTITFNSKGNYSGTTTANYTIAPASITGVTVKLNPASFTFDGNSHIPAVTASFGNTDLTEDVDYSAQITSADGSGTSAGTNAGTVTITLNGKGNYSGTTTTNYTIGKVSMSNVTISDTPLTYSGAEQTPEVTFNGTTLKKDKDYSIEITSTDDSGDGTSAGTNAGTVSITLTGKGNYSGTTTANYTIGKVPMNNVTISDTPLTYSGAEQTPEVTYNGNTLKKDKDYSVKITSTDDSGDGTSAGTNAGTVSITVTGKGNYTGTKTAAYTISKVPLTITNATVSNKAYDGTVAATVGSVTLSGFINNETLTFNQDYTVSGTFSDAQIGTNKQVLVTVTMLNTAKANHYAVPGVYVCRANIHNDRSSYDDNTNTGTALPALLTDAATGVEADISGAAFPMSVNGVTLSTTRPKISGASADPQGAAAYQLAVSSTALNIVGSPSLYSIKLLNQNGSTISSFTGSVIVKLPVPVGIHGTPRVFRREPDGTFTDMNAKVENGYLVFRTTHFSYYIVAGTGDSITLDTKSYEMPLGGEYRIGVKQTGKKNVALKVRSTNSGVAAARLANGSVQVNGTGVGTAWIILDVFDDKNKLLAHVSTRIDVKTGIRPRGDSTRQIVAYTVRDTADSLTLDTKSYELTIGGKYQIGAWLTGGKAVTVRYYSANNKIASVTKLPNGNYQVTGNRKGTTWIMFDVYDSKNEFLTHASTHIDVKDGVHPNGNSAKQIGVF